MTYDEAKSEIVERIDAHPKNGTVSEVIENLDLSELATEVADEASRKRSMMLNSFRDTAKAYLYEEMGPSIEEASIRDEEQDVLPTLFRKGDKAPEHVYWVHRWTHFRMASILGQVYFTGAPAVKLRKDPGNVEIGFVKEIDQNEGQFKNISKVLSEIQVEEFIHQSRQSHKESPEIHENVDTLCDGWERIFDETNIFEG